MSYEIYRTTAEQVIGATDAALQKNDGVDETLVAQFLDITDDYALNSLNMAEQLGLLAKKQSGDFIPKCPYAVYLITSDPQHKAAILRFVLEQYPPYKTFKFRVALTGNASEAANQTRAFYAISAHREEIQNTLINLGTYANSLVSEAAGRYRPVEGEADDYILMVEAVIQDRVTAELHVRRKMGSEAADWIDQREVFEPLVTAYQLLKSVKEDSKAPISHAGNAIESFLSQIANHYGVNIRGATGINAKAEQIANDSKLTKKHLNMLKYLGHVRNAADHGTDSEIGRAWEISQNTAIEYVHVAMSVITDIVAHLNGRFVV
jgi:hypothetical protein